MGAGAGVFQGLRFGFWVRVLVLGIVFMVWDWVWGVGSQLAEITARRALMGISIDGPPCPRPPTGRGIGGRGFGRPWT